MDTSVPPFNPYVLPLTREGYRQLILSLHTPLVVILATEQAQNDLENACGLHQDVGSGRPSFASLFHPFGCLPGSYQDPRYPTDQRRQYGCPQGVSVKLLDKTRSLDVFPVRFSDVNSCVPMPSSVADSRLLKAVESNLPSLNALRMVHRLHSFSSRLLERKGAEVECPSTSSESLQGNFSNVTSTYPHSELRGTNTYRKSHPDTASSSRKMDNATFCSDSKPMYTGIETEAEIFDQLYLTVPIDSTAISSASTIPCVWWDAWSEALCRSLDFSEFESLGLPLGFVFIASTRDPDPAAAFDDLGQSSNLSPLCRQQLVDSSAVRAYVLVHTSLIETEGWSTEDDDRRVSHAFGSVCSAFPPTSCHILMFRPINPMGDPIASLIHAHFDSIQAVAHTIITRSVLPFMERIVKRLSDNLTLHRRGLRSHLRNFWGRRSRAANGQSSTSVAESALDTTADLLWGAVGGTDDASTRKDSKSVKGGVEPTQVCSRFINV